MCVSGGNPWHNVPPLSFVVVVVIIIFDALYKSIM